MIISRQDEANFPDFKSVEEARTYFEERYGDKYNRGFWERLSEDQICYFDDVDGQPVQISKYEDGFISIHVVY
jgi:hypothetical protein